MIVRRRALLLSSLIVPLASGCTLWYLATDPFDGIGVGTSDGGASDGASGDAPYSSECGALDTQMNCGACGHTCVLDAACTGQGTGQSKCGEVLLSLGDGDEAAAIAAWDDSLFVLGTSGAVWTCTGDCPSFTQIVPGSGGGSGSPRGIYASDAGIFWASATLGGIAHAGLDGGELEKLVDASGPSTVVASGTRVAWTTYPEYAVLWSDRLGASMPSGSAGPHYIVEGGADLNDLGFAENARLVAWVDDTNGSANLSAIGPDAEVLTQFQAPIPKNATINLASDNVYVAVTSSTSDKSDNELRIIAPPYDGGFAYALSTNGPAEVYVHEGVVYWADDKVHLHSCVAAGCSAASQTTVDINSAGNILQIAVTRSHIFFLTSQPVNGAIYMVAEPP